MSLSGSCIHRRPCAHAASRFLFLLIYHSGPQTHQNAKHSRALIQQGRAARITDTALRIAELRDSNGIDGCFQGTRDVSAKDLARFTNICRAIFISAEDSFLQHEQGLLDETAFESFETSVRAGMGAPGVAAGWIIRGICTSRSSART